MRRLFGYVPLVIIAVSLVLGLIGRITEDGPGIDERRADDPITERRREVARRAQVGDKVQTRRPDPRGNPRGVRELPGPSGRDPSIIVEIPPEAQNSQGTAFSIDSRGVWLTARHVADGCERMFIVTGPRQGLRVDQAYIHESADLAVLRTRRGAPPFAIISEPLRIGQAGYHFGYPSGEPAAVSSRLMGRAVMRVSGRYRTQEPVVAWAESLRAPEREGGLQGISGGPAVDGNGRLVGVTVAGSRRRGRVFTTALVSVRQALRRARASIADAGAGQAGMIDESNFAARGEALRSALSVAPVVCLVEGRGRTGRRGRPRK